MSEWQPMETAPTSGQVLLFMNGGAMVVGQWVKEMTTGEIRWFIAQLPDNDRLIVKNPLYWMKLPNPPELTEEKL